MDKNGWMKQKMRNSILFGEYYFVPVGEAFRRTGDACLTQGVELVLLLLLHRLALLLLALLLLQFQRARLHLVVHRKVGRLVLQEGRQRAVRRAHLARTEVVRVRVRVGIASGMVARMQRVVRVVRVVRVTATQSKILVIHSIISTFYSIVILLNCNSTQLQFN